MAIHENGLMKREQSDAEREDCRATLNDITLTDYFAMLRGWELLKQ